MNRLLLLLLELGPKVLLLLLVLVQGPTFPRSIPKAYKALAFPHQAPPLLLLASRTKPNFHRLALALALALVTIFIILPPPPLLLLLLHHFRVPLLLLLLHPQP